jgi:cyclopropane fatty-acyl-phospholipid synthase-like methyltransferase
MKSLILSLKREVRKLLNPEREFYEENGERVYIDLNTANYQRMDKYQKNHIKRYEFASARLKVTDTVGDFACGTGYGTALMSNYCANIIGADIDKKIVNSVANKYRHLKNAEFINIDLLQMNFKNKFDKVVSFETIEHLEEKYINTIFKNFAESLKENGELIFSVPYMQIESENAVIMGHHKTFLIDEQKIENWLTPNQLKLTATFYQNYRDHEVREALVHKEFILCIATRNS